MCYSRLCLGFWMRVCPTLNTLVGIGYYGSDSASFWPFTTSPHPQGGYNLEAISKSFTAVAAVVLGNKPDDLPLSPPPSVAIDAVRSTIKVESPFTPQYPSFLPRLINLDHKDNNPMYALWSSFYPKPLLTRSKAHLNFWKCLRMPAKVSSAR